MADWNSRCQRILISIISRRTTYVCERQHRTHVGDEVEQHLVDRWLLLDLADLSELSAYFGPTARAFFLGLQRQRNATTAERVTTADEPQESLAFLLQADCWKASVDRN